MVQHEYPRLSALRTGVAGKCPRCGQGKLFSGYLKLAKACTVCGLSYEFADSGDGAAWFVMLFVCVVGVGGIIGVELAYAPPLYVHVAMAIPVLILLPLLLLRPMKGVLLNQQWLTSAREGQIHK